MKHFVLLVGVLCALSARADLILSISPNLDEETYRQVYHPVADELSALLEEKVVLDYSSDWLTYAKRMRSGGFDIVIDDAHFVAWRLIAENMGHRGLVQLGGENRYVLVTQADSAIEKREDFAYKAICSRNSPDLATVYFLRLFPNPVKQPAIVNARSADKALSYLAKGRCQGAIVREDEVSLEGYKLVDTSVAMPRPALTVRSNLPVAVQSKLKTYFLQQEAVAEKLSRSWGFGDVPAVEPFNPERYRKMNLLSGQVWGW